MNWGHFSLLNLSFSFLFFFLFFFPSKPKFTIKEEILEKHGDLVEASPPGLTCLSPPTSPLQKSFAIPYQEREKLLYINQEDMNVGGSLHTCLLKEQLAI